jgi:DNA-binding CsgD family transcriptional regulator
VARARWTTERLAEDLAALGRRGLPREQFYAEAVARLRRVVDCDASCWHTLDPQTRLITSDGSDELVSSGILEPDAVSQAGAKMIASEYFVPDVNTFAGLAARRSPVGILSQVTQGRPARSPRYAELLAPAGIPFELRAAFVSRGRAWGAVHLARREDRPDFTVQDAAVLASLSGVIADGIRTSLRSDAAREGRDRGAPGMVVIGPGDEVELITPPARELLAAMNSGRGDETLPSAVLALVAFTRGRREGDTVAVPTPSGWITLHASLPEGRAAGRVAVVLERSASPQSTAVRLEARGVTPREREIAGLLAQGLSNPEIAAALVLSPYTVQDHVRSLFEKTGVSSRQELVAQIFLEDYLPRMAEGAPLSSDGTFSA